MMLQGHGLHSLTCAVLVVLAGAPFARAQEDVIELYDGFDDTELFDEFPVDWNGAMTLTATQRGGNRRIRDGWLQIWNHGDWSVETATRRVFRGDVSVRTLLRSVGKPGAFVNVIAHGAPGRAYVGTLQDDVISEGFPFGYIGNASIMRLDADNNPDILVAIEIEGFDPNDEYILQLDVIGDELELRVWRPNEAFPEEPLLSASDTRYRSGEVGVSAYYPRFQRGNGVTHYLQVDYIWIRNETLGADDVPPPERAPETLFRRGDCNDDGTVDVSDPIAHLSALFLGEGEITCDDVCDSNDDGDVDVSDPITTLSHLFLGDPAVIAAPGTKDCGVDPTADELSCDRYVECGVQ